MKITSLLLAGIIAYFGYKTIVGRTHVPSVIKEPDRGMIVKYLHIIFLQDFSKSIHQNGVEIADPQLFSIYADSIYCDIQLGYGAICSRSTSKIVSVYLPAFALTRPKPVDPTGLAPSNYHKAMVLYAKQLTKYHQDSQLFVGDRRKRLREFMDEVREATKPFIETQTDSTDLASAISVADKAFSFSFAENPRRFLILNSDGFDSKNISVDHLHSNAEVLLVSANRDTTTNVDKIVTLKLQDPADALLYTIIHNH